MKRSLSTVLWGVLFTSVVAGALTLSMVKLWQTRFARPAVGTPPQGVVSARLAASSEMVGTENPVPANPTPELAPASKHKASNSPTTSSPQISNLAETDSQLQPQPSRASVRAKAEQTRKKAERMRAHVEGLYQQHRISEAEYKKGQAEYQHELTAYEDQIAKYHGAMTGTGAANE
jgi:hypothetical protein